MRTLLWILVALAVSSPAQGQTRGGLLGGFTFPKFTDQTRYDSERRFQAGLLGSRNFGSIIALQGEFYYSELASNAESSNAGSSTAADGDTTITSIRLNYFEAPALLRLNLNRTGGIYVAVGGALGVKLRCAVTITEDSVEREEGCAYAGRELIEDTNLAAVLGGGLQIRVFGQALGGDLRFIGGWTDVRDARRLTVGRAMENYSVALTGRFIPVFKKDENPSHPPQ